MSKLFSEVDGLELSYVNSSVSDILSCIEYTQYEELINVNCTRWMNTQQLQTFQAGY